MSLETTQPQVKVRTFKALTAGSNVIMPNGKKLTFGGPIGGHGVYVTSNSSEVRFLEEMVKFSNGQIWEEAAPEQEAAIVAASPVVNDTKVAAADVAAIAEKSVNPRLAAMAATLGNIDANTAVPAPTAG